jgi:SAM-dependent methyltransferase
MRPPERPDSMPGAELRDEANPTREDPSMGETVSNRDRYTTTDFEKWASRRPLRPQERWLIERHLSRAGDTLEAGTGGGSILLAMRDMGFGSLTGFDNVPAMIRSARAADPAGDVTFDVMDATDLVYADGSFDQLIYLQILLCLVESEGGRAGAVREAYRVLRSGGVALFSVASWEARETQPLARAVGTWLRVLRLLRRTDRSPRDWPHLHANDQLNPSALLDRGPYIHWFTRREAEDLLKMTGFSIVWSSVEPEDMAATDGVEGFDGSAMYFVCTKP